MSYLDALNPRQRKFVEEYCVDENATKAAQRAGYSFKSARQIASQIMAQDYIQDAIARRKKELAIAAGASREYVVSEWLKIATADVREIVEVRVGCCRFCWGAGHAYQWTQGEYDIAVNRAIRKGEEPPDADGGFGFTLNRDPHPDCPECGGNGAPRVHLHDTRKLGDAASAVYLGAEQTRHGVKINIRDKDAALNNLARWLGMVVTKNELSGPGGSPLTAPVRAEDCTDAQLAAIIAKAGEEDGDVDAG